MLEFRYKRSKTQSGLHWSTHICPVRPLLLYLFHLHVCAALRILHMQQRS
jgi:hypothetical protein